MKHRHVAVGTAVLALALAGCGTGENAGAGKPTTGSTFDSAQATAMLAAFDQTDSAASRAGDLPGLRAQETSPALDASIAAVRKAQHYQTKQPEFRHDSPAFAIPAGEPSCLLVSAALRLTGGELPMVDFSQFVRAPGGDWRLSHNVQVAREGQAAVRETGRAPAVPTAQAVGDRSRQAIAAEVFARTTAADANTSLVASSTLLDKQLAAGWSIYTQQLAGAKLSVTRTLDRTEWSACAAPVSAGTLTFLTVYATDTVTALPGGPAQVTLPAASPDLIALGQATPASGRSVQVSRVEVFLLLVPGAESAPATVLGLSDAPTAITTASS